MSEHKTMLITGSKLTNYASFLFLAAELGEEAACTTEEPSALVCITWIWHREVLCEDVQGDMDIKAQGPCPNAKRFPWLGPWGSQTGEHNEL